MGDLKFMPQSVLDVWTDLGKIELTGTTLRIPAENVTFQLTPAVRFTELLEGQDTHRLLQKVKAESYVREIGGEVLTDSCIVGETAYQVQPGFLAEGEVLAAAQKSKATKQLAPKPVAATFPPAGRPADPLTQPGRAATPQVGAAPAIQPAMSGAKSDDADLLTRFLLESLD